MGPPKRNSKNKGRNEPYPTSTQATASFPSHVNLETSNVSYEGHPENLIGTLLPYLSLGFTTCYTPAAGLHCGLFALAASFDAATFVLYGDGRDDLLRVSVTQWGRWFKSKRYKEIVQQYVNRHPLYRQSNGNARVDIIESLMRSEFLSNEQLHCLLQVGNEKTGMNFQLGIIHQGYRKHDSTVVKTCLLKADGFSDLQNKPMLWVYFNNADTILEEQAKFNGTAETANGLQATKKQNLSTFNEKATSSCNHWEGFMKIKPTEQFYSLHRKRISEFAVGGLAEADIQAGVYVLLNDYFTPGGLTDVYRGTFLRAAKDQSNVPYGCQRMETSAGKMLIVGKNEMWPLHQDLLAPTARLDEHWAIDEEKLRKANESSVEHTVSSIDKSINIDKEVSVSVNKASSTKTEGTDAKQLRLFRFIAAPSISGKSYPISHQKSLDAIQRPINQFTLDIGDLVLDTGERGIRSHITAARVIKADGTSGWVWLDRLQYLERPFTLRDDLKQLPPFTPFNSTSKPNEVIEFANSIGIDITGKPLPQIINLVNEKVQKDEIGLLLYEVNHDSLKDKSGEVNLEKGEYVILDSSVKGSGRPPTYTVRDVEGHEADVKKTQLKRIACRAWALRIDKKSLPASGLFQTRTLNILPEINEDEDDQVDELAGESEPVQAALPVKAKQNKSASPKYAAAAKPAARKRGRSDEEETELPSPKHRPARTVKG